MMMLTMMMMLETWAEEDVDIDCVGEVGGGCEPVSRGVEKTSLFQFLNTPLNRNNEQSRKWFSPFLISLLTYLQLLYY